MNSESSLRTEKLTLAVLMCGVASLALSDFVSPVYWSLSVLAGLLRLWLGPRFSLSELQASMIGWLGFFWVGLELALGRAWIVAFTDFLLILAMAVVIEAPTARNHLHRMLVGVFLVLAAAVLTDSVLYVFPLIALMWFMWRASVCLYGLNWPGGDLTPVPAKRDMPTMFGMALLAGLLFVAMPRFDVHSLLQPTQPRKETSGFSDQVQLGDFARELDATVVMRVEPMQAGLSAEQIKAFRRQIEGRYWRGTSLARFTGRGWQRQGGVSIRHWSRNREVELWPGPGLEAAVYREASDHAYIQIPDGLLRIHQLPEPAAMSAGGAMTFDRPPAHRLRLQMELGGRTDKRFFSTMHAPDSVDSSTELVPAALKRWVSEVTRGAADPAGALERVVDELHSWTYDLNASIDAVDPVSSFLSIKRGHCELYATTLALAARSLGVPSRVVNGYFGGQWNDVGGFLVIREQHAHSWTEVWLNGRWQRLDATPASRWSLSGVRFPEIDAIWETVKLSWYRYVLEFQESDRTALAKQFWQQLRTYGIKLVFFGLLLALGLLLVRSMQRMRFWQRFGFSTPSWPVLDRWLSRRGCVRQAYQPLRDVAVPMGISENHWYEFVQAWEMQAYGAARPWNRRELKRHLRAL